MTFCRPWDQVPCQGRGQPPEPEAVNRFCWTLYDYLKSVSAKYVVVHCTHGYNRTGGPHLQAGNPVSLGLQV